MEEENKYEHDYAIEKKMDDVSPHRSGWSKGEDDYLRAMVELHGIGEWANIVENVNNRFLPQVRTEEECRERWFEYLDPFNTKKPWNEEEELQMLVGHFHHKNKWADVAAELSGRSGNTVKNKFYCIFRKVKNKILKNDISHTSRVELLEIFYMIALMEQYFAKGIPAYVHKGKRGKDFILTLLHNLKWESIQRYKRLLSQYTGREEKLEDLWAELVSPKKQQKTGRVIESPVDFPIIPIIDEPMSKHPIMGQALRSVGAMQVQTEERTLPRPLDNDHPGSLSQDEKEYFLSCLKTRPEPCSAEVFSGSFAMSPGFSPMVPMSAGRSIGSLMSSQIQYEGFSDFTTNPKLQFSTGRPIQPSSIFPSASGFAPVIRSPPVPTQFGGLIRPQPMHSPNPIMQLFRPNP